jgi:hypothetical protein
MGEAAWSELFKHEPILAGVCIVGALVVQSFKLYRWLDRKFDHVNGDIGELKNVAVDSGLAAFKDKSDGIGKRLVVRTVLHVHHRATDDEETPT